MATDPYLGSASFYKLCGDGMDLCSTRDPSFVTRTTLELEISSALLRQYGECLRLRKGTLPYQSGALVGLNYALEEVFRASWLQSFVTRIFVPPLDISANRLAVFRSRLELPRITLGELPVKAPPSKVIAPRREDPVPAYTFRFSIGGIDASPWLIRKVDAFDFGLGTSGDVVVTITQDAATGPYRDWLAGGNEPRSGTLDMLSANLSSVVFRFQFAGLRIRSIVPTYTTFSINPATVQLSFGSVNLVPA